MPRQIHTILSGTVTVPTDAELKQQHRSKNIQDVLEFLSIVVFLWLLQEVLT